VTPLADAFLLEQPEAARASFLPKRRLESTLAQHLEGGRTAWPTVDVPAADYLQHLAERAANLDALAALDGSGLYLACACAMGNETAMRVFAETYRPDLLRVLGRMGVAAKIDEVLHGMMGALFVGPAPTIAGY